MRLSTRRIALAVVLLVASGAAIGWFAVPAAREREASRAFTALAICLAGPKRVSAEDAAVLARRAHRSEPGVLTRCLPAAERLDTNGVGAVAGTVAVEAKLAATSLRKEKLPPNVAALVRAGEELRWLPEPDATAALAIPAPLLDRDIPALRAAFPTYAFIYALNPDDRMDDNPLGLVTLRASRNLEIGPGEGGQPLSRATWLSAPPAFLRNVSAPEGRVELNDASGKHDLGAGRHPVLMGDHVLFHDAGKLHARRVDAILGPQANPGSTGRAPASEHVLDLDLETSASFLRFSSCRARATTMIAVETRTQVHVLSLDEASLRVVARFPMAHPDTPAKAGLLGLTCGDAEVRLAWAVSEPPADAKVGAGELVLPKGEHGHRIFVERCSERGCTRTEGHVRDIEIGWSSIGGWLSPKHLEAPLVYALENRVLLVWAGAASVSYRLAALDALDKAPTLWIAELSRDKEPVLDRMLSWPQFHVHAETSAALVILNEGGSATFIVRIDASGEARALMPAER